MPVSHVECCDCMEFMARYPDKHFELAIVDPPYGIGCDVFGIGGSKPHLRTANKHPKKWDSSKPNRQYFNDLFRCSQNQIIFGGNHFTDMIPPSASYIFWDKETIEGLTLGDGELAWCSIGGRVKKFKHQWCGYIRESEREPNNRIHPTQKPIVLYRWLLHNYAKPGDKILDTHLGSGSSRIAAWDMGFDFYGCELDREYFDASVERFERFRAQLKLQLEA